MARLEFLVEVHDDAHQDDGNDDERADVVTQDIGNDARDEQYIHQRVGEEARNSPNNAKRDSRTRLFGPYWRNRACASVPDNPWGVVDKLLNNCWSGTSQNAVFAGIVFAGGFSMVCIPCYLPAKTELVVVITIAY